MGKFWLLIMECLRDRLVISLLKKIDLGKNVWIEKWSLALVFSLRTQICLLSRWVGLFQFQVNLDSIVYCALFYLFACWECFCENYCNFVLYQSLLGLSRSSIVLVSARDLRLHLICIFHPDDFRSLFELVFLLGFLYFLIDPILLTLISLSPFPTPTQPVKNRLSQ